jgi:hypothetical protein
MKPGACGVLALIKVELATLDVSCTDIVAESMWPAGDISMSFIVNPRSCATVGNLSPNNVVVGLPVLILSLDFLHTIAFFVGMDGIFEVFVICFISVTFEDLFITGFRGDAAFVLLV